MDASSTLKTQGPGFDAATTREPLERCPARTGAAALETCNRQLRQRRTEARPPRVTGVAPSSWPPRRAADTRRAPWNPQLERIIGFRIGGNSWAFAFTAFGRSQCSMSRIGQVPLWVQIAVL